jgi:hypothetical protein
MPAVVVFGLSAIACRDFFLYYWRAMAWEPVPATIGGSNDIA